MEIFSLIAAAFLLFRPQVAASVNMDSSGSVREKNFQKIKLFVADTAKQMTIGQHDVQIGLTAFSGIVRPQFNLNTYSSVGALVNATMKVDYRDTHGTNTSQALEWIEKNAFTKENGDRSDADNVLIVVTDGKSNNKPATLSRAADLHRYNITIYAIGVGGNYGLDMEELTAIATDRSHMIVVDTFDKLHSLGANITKRECNEKKRSTLVSKSIFTTTMMSHTQPSETQTFPSSRNDVIRNNTKSSTAHSTVLSTFPLVEPTVSLYITLKASRPTFLSPKRPLDHVLSSVHTPIQSHQTVPSSNAGSGRSKFLSSKRQLGHVLSSAQTPIQSHKTVASSNAGSDQSTFLSSKRLFGHVVSSVQPPIQSYQTVATRNPRSDRSTFLSSKRHFGHVVSSVQTPVQPHLTGASNAGSCRSSVCVHGTCVPVRSDYLCICQPGYIGKNCDVDEDDCRSQPCVYGQCIDQVNGYHCQCSVLFSGKNCSKLRTWSTMAIALGALLLLIVCCCCRLCCPTRRRSDDDDEEENRRKQRPLPTKKVEAWPR